MRRKEGGTARIQWAVAVVLVLAGVGLATPVEPQHPVYGFLRRLELLGAASPGFLGTLPWDDGDILAALRSAEGRRDLLSPGDRRLLDQHLAELDPARRAQVSRLQAEGEGYRLSGGVAFWGAGYIRDSLPEADRFLIGSLTPGVEAAFLDGGFLAASASVGMERSAVERFTETYRLADGLPYNTSREGKAGIPQGVSTFDGFRVALGYGRGPLRLDVGQDWNRWGPGHRQRATLGTDGYFWTQDSLPASDSVGYPGTAHPGRHRRGYRRPGETAPMPQLRLAFRGRTFTYVKVVAQRDGILEGGTATLVAHRLEWRPRPWIALGGTELASIGERVPEPVHWLPLVPLKFMEHQVRDKDNLALSADVELLRRGLGRLYGELYLDDFSGPPFDFWGNKFAWTLGGEWIDPLRRWGLPGALRAEFAQVDPWVFTHNLPDRQHQHAGALYGSRLPGNARALWFEAEAQLPRSLVARASYAWQARDLRSRGSSPFDVFMPGVDDREKAFLAETPETRHQAGVELTRSWRRHVAFTAGAGWLVVEDWKGRAGEGLSGPTLVGELALRY